MLTYNKERTEIQEDEHALANELTEAINSYMDGQPGNEIRESLDVAMVIGQMLMVSPDRKANIAKVLRSLNAMGMNALVSEVIEKKDVK